MSEHIAWQQKRDKYAAIRAMIRPSRNAGKVAPPPVHLPPRKKMKARAA